jgi:CPA1 family monovalent cation:H+ antiporter
MPRHDASDVKKTRSKQGTHGNILYHTHHDPRGLSLRGGYTRTALSGSTPLIQIGIGALLAWPTFGLHVEFDPELFLVLFIPPLLFADGWKTPTREFIEHGREIFGLALALVVVTVVGIGYLIYWIVPGIPLIPAFALAAVLSPTDAVALSGIVGEGRIPKK